jgi:C4-dicarboxylate transporter DctQ subunit
MNAAERRGFTDHIEETLLAILMGTMTVITFANVIARYVFNSNILWALEATVYLFAWMVLLGASYCVKINAHLGVDVVANLVGPGARKVFALFAAAMCLLFSGLLFVGTWNYWGPFANVPPVPNLYNDWIAGPLGLGEIKNQWRDQAWYEVDSVPMGDWLRFIEPMFNEGERYTYIPKFIPYAVLPLSMALMIYRFAQAGLRVMRDQQGLLIASHEAEDEIDDAAARAAGEKA